MTFIESRYFGPAFTSGEPRQIVTHSVESDIIPGLARSLAGGWFRNPTNKTSAHGIADPREHIDTVHTTQRAWHCGNGNSTSLGREHVGRAAFTRAQWTTSLGMAMLRNAARADARDAKMYGIPLRWLSLTQLARNEKGFCTHNDMRLVRGGTTHTDPGPGFPYDLYMQMVKEELGVTPTPPKEMTPLMKAEARYQELLDRNGVSDAAARHFDTGLENIYKAVGPKDIEKHVRRLGELMQGKPIDLAGALHLQTALRNIRRAGGK